MADIKDFSTLFRLDGKIAVVTGGESFLSFEGCFRCFAISITKVSERTVDKRGGRA